VGLGDGTTPGANLIAYHSGWGDGSYPTWIGRSTSGDVACFVTDMLLYDKVDLDLRTDAPQGAE
jgi:hypothetical protein